MSVLLASKLETRGDGVIVSSEESICNHVPMDSGSGTITIDCNNQLIVHAHIKATGNVTIEVSNFDDTMLLFLMTEQDATGGRVFSFSANFHTGNMPTQTTSASAMDTWIWALMMGKFHRHSFESNVK